MVLLSNFGAKWAPRKLQHPPMTVTRAGRGICTRGDGFKEQEAAGAGWDGCAMGREEPFLGGEPACGSLVVGGTEGWKAKNGEPCSSQAAQLCEPKPCRDEPSAWRMQLQPGEPAGCSPWRVIPQEPGHQVGQSG